MSYIFASSSFPKVRQEGFHTQQQQQSGPQPATASQSGQQNIPAPNAFDPNAIYTTGALFAEAYRATPADPFARRYEQQQQAQQQQQMQQQPQQQQAQPATSLDIHDELSFLNPPNSATSDSFQQQQQQRPHDIFGVNQPHYPSLSLPHSRPLYPRDEYSSTTPASLHNSYGRPDYFPNGGQQHTASATSNNHPNELTPQQQQQQQQFGLMSTAPSLPNPMPSSLDSFNPGGEQSPAIGVTRSRSRSRSKVSVSRSRVSKRPSLPAPPHTHEEDGEDEEEASPPRSSSRAQSSTRPSAIVIPGHTTHPGAAQQQHPHALSHQHSHSHSHHQQQHSFSGYHTAGGTTSPATWGFPGHTGGGGGGGGGGGQEYGVDGHPIFGQSYGGQLGPGQSPTTHSGSPPPSAHPDAATKLALANEKRRKRRESHNAVERRRRDNINEKIQELALLLPEEWLEGPTSPTSGTASGKGPSIAGLLSGTVSGSALSAHAGGGAANAGLLDDDSKEIKANKGVILRNSVEYIKNLVQLVQVQRTRNQQLESELAQYRNRFGNVMGGAASITMNGVGPLSMNGGNGMSPSGVQLSGHTDDEANAMAGYVLADSLSSPEGFDMKSMFGASGSIGPLDTLGGTHGHALSSGAMGMEGVESSSLGAAGMGMMGMTHSHNNIGGANGNANGQNVLSSGAAGGVSAMLMDTQSPSTGSGEGDEQEDEDMPRGRRTTRFPAGVGKVEDEMGAL